MKVCFVGLGSIGKRHLKNFIMTSADNGIKSIIHAFRETDNKLDSESELLLDKTFNHIDEADEDYDIVFICNPTNKHFNTVRQFIGKTKNIFIEKPLGNIDENYSSIPFHSDGIYYVASPLKFSPVVEYLKKNIDINRIFSVRAICSSYLPDWRTGKDYREYYSAKKGEGGGVILDLIHEWDYLRYLFGDPKNLMCYNGKYSELEIDSDDLAVYIADYGDKIVELHIDYFGRFPERSVMLYTDKNTIYADFINNQIRYCGTEKIISLENQDMYINEMCYFLNLVLYGGENRNTIENAIKTIKIAYGRI